jgi:hypothetical protein
MFLLFLVVMIALTIDIGISVVADIVAKQAVSLLGITLFVVISGIYCVGQFFILEMVKAKNRENRILSSNPNRFFDRVVTIVQYVLVAIMILVVIQILSTSHYYTYLLIAAVAASYGLATVLMGFLTFRLFSWLRINRSLVLLLYALAAAAITYLLSNT